MPPTLSSVKPKPSNHPRQASPVTSTLTLAITIFAAGSLLLTAGCYEKTTYRRGLGKDAYEVNRSSPSSISDSKTDPMILTPPPKTRMAW